ncbi:hypothetical protein TNCV_3899261 [Trichonephila clavipes]|nr:hypothetical protein TNCV_3899261 [Trichonephila clavipes]
MFIFHGTQKALGTSINVLSARMHHKVITFYLWASGLQSSPQSDVSPRRKFFILWRGRMVIGYYEENREVCLSISSGWKIEWSTTAELSNRHCSCGAVSSSIRVSGGGKHKDTAWPRASQKIFNGVKVGRICWPRHTCNPFNLQVVIDDVSSVGTCVIVH